VKVDKPLRHVHLSREQSGKEADRARSTLREQTLQSPERDPGPIEELGPRRLFVRSRVELLALRLNGVRA